MLSDAKLYEAMASGLLVITPKPEARAIQPASIDLRLAAGFACVKAPPVHSDFIDPRRDSQHANPEFVASRADNWMLRPLGFCLARTVEHIDVSPKLAARVEGKSTLGRFGLAIHATAGFVDPGFSGHITLELFNFTQYPIRLHAGMYICQLAIHRIEGVVQRPYGHHGLGSHYQGQKGVVPPR